MTGQHVVVIYREDDSGAEVVDRVEGPFDGTGSAYDHGSALSRRTGISWDLFAVQKPAEP